MPSLQVTCPEREVRRTHRQTRERCTGRRAKGRQPDTPATAWMTASQARSSARGPSGPKPVMVNCTSVGFRPCSCAASRPGRASTPRRKLLTSMHADPTSLTLEEIRLCRSAQTPAGGGLGALSSRNRTGSTAIRAQHPRHRSCHESDVEGGELTLEMGGMLWQPSRSPRHCVKAIWWTCDESPLACFEFGMMVLIEFYLRGPRQCACQCRK